MAKTKISEFSTTAGNNTDINSINIAEGCAPSGINDAIRELMRQLKEFQTGGAGDSVNSGGDFSVATNKFTVASASGNTAVAGTLAVTGVATLTAQPILSSLTASKAVFTDASKGLVSNDVTGTGNVVMSNSPTLVTPALGTPSSGVVTNLTGTASININGTVGATTPSTGAFTTLSSTGNTTLGDASGDTITINGTTTFANANPTLSAGTANGVLYLNGSKVATSGSALVFDGTNLGIGTSSPTAKLDVRSTIVSRDTATPNTTANSYYAGGAYTSNMLMLLNGYSVSGNNSIFYGGGSGSYEPATNHIFMTGTAGSLGAGSEQMRLTSTGLGIGTSSPAYKLDVVGAAGFSSTVRVGTASGPKVLQLGADTPIANNGGALRFNTSTTTTNWQISSNFVVTAGSLEFTPSTAAGGSTWTTPALTLTDTGNLGLGVTPSAWISTWKALQVGQSAALTSGGVSDTVLSCNTYLNSSAQSIYLNTGAASRYYQANGVHYWYNAPSGTAGNAITFTQAATLDANGNFMVGVTSTSFRINATVSSGANRDVFAAQVSGASNGLTVKWNHATTTTRVNIADLPTSSAGLASGDLWNDSGTLKIA